MRSSCDHRKGSFQWSILKGTARYFGECTKDVKDTLTAILLCDFFINYSKLIEFHARIRITRTIRLLKASKTAKNG